MWEPTKPSFGDRAAVVALLETRGLHPHDRGGYIKFTCPVCNRKGAAYTHGTKGVYSAMQCSHKHGCGFSAVIAVYFELTPSWLQQLEAEQLKARLAYVEAHGIKPQYFYDLGLLTDALAIPLIRLKGEQIYKELQPRQDRAGKFYWKLPSGWNGEVDGELYPVLHVEADRLYIVEGDYNWLLGLQDGLTCTTTLFGSKYTHLKNPQSWAVFVPYKEIVLVYDTDVSGQEGAGGLSMTLKRHFPKKLVGNIKLPFTADEVDAFGKPPKDYCDYRLRHSSAEFSQLEVVWNDYKASKKLPRGESATHVTILPPADGLAAARLAATVTAPTLVMPTGAAPATTASNATPESPVADATTPPAVTSPRDVALANAVAALGQQQRQILAPDGGSYVITNTGIWKQRLISNGEGPAQLEQRNICRDPVILTEMLTDMLTAETMYKLEWADREAVVPTAWLWSKNHDELTKLGIRVLTANSFDLAEYFLVSMNLLTGVTYYSSQNGWIGDQFIVGERLFSAGKAPAEIQRNYSVPIGIEGGFDKWRAAVDPWLDNSQCLIVLAASAMAPMIAPMHMDSFIIHVWGESSTSKSFYVKLAASMWGNFHKLLKGWTATKVGLEMYYKEMQNLPVFLDDSQLVSDETISAACYMFANQIGKTRGTLAGGHIALAKPSEWGSIMLSTGEKTITEASTYSGLTGRVIELYRDRPSKKEPMLFVETLRKITSDYGAPGALIIQYILDNKADLMDAYHRQVKALYDTVGAELTINLQTRQLPFWAMIFLGLSLNKELLGIDFDERDILREMRHSIARVGEKKAGESLYQTCCEMFHSNEQRFHTKTHNKGCGPVYFKTKENEVWGVHDVTDKIVYFFTDILKRELAKRKFSFSQLEFLKSKNLLACDANRNQKQLRFDGEKFYCVGIKLCDELELEASADRVAAQAIIQPLAATVPAPRPTGTQATIPGVMFETPPTSLAGEAVD